MTTATSAATRSELQRWLLKITAILTPVFFLHECVIFALVRADADAEMTRAFATYLAVAFATAVGNVVAWWRATPSQTQAFVQLTLNMIALGVFVALGVVLYGVRVAPLLLPVFAIVVVIAAILCDFPFALVVAVLAAAEYGAIILWGKAHDVVDPGILQFLPASCLFLPMLALPISYVARALTHNEAALRSSVAELDDANTRLRRAQTALQKHVAPQLARLLFDEEAERALAHRRRKVTLFFSDVKDFTVSVDAIEPEELGRLLNNYLDEMVRLAIAHNGTVAQISGDGLFIIFGAPDFVDDATHANDAVAMAVAMQRRMAELRSTWFRSGIEHPFHIRCGINTGVATVGAFGAEGRREYSAVGLQTNIAARLEGACTPDRVLVSHATWALVHERFPCVDLGERELKGVGRPMRVYEIDPHAAWASASTTSSSKTTTTTTTTAPTA
jgi:class 3 adenylate cyclase